MTNQKLNNICKETKNLSGQKKLCDGLRLEALIATVNCVEIIFRAFDKKFGGFERERIIAIMRNYVENKDKNQLTEKINHFLKVRKFRSIHARDQILEDVLEWCEI